MARFEFVQFYETCQNSDLFDMIIVLKAIFDKLIIIFNRDRFDIVYVI